MKKRIICHLPYPQQYPPSPSSFKLKLMCPHILLPALFGWWPISFNSKSILFLFKLWQRRKSLVKKCHFFFDKVQQCKGKRTKDKSNFSERWRRHSKEGMSISWIAIPPAKHFVITWTLVSLSEMRLLPDQPRLIFLSFLHDETKKKKTKKFKGFSGEYQGSWMRTL